MKIGTTGPGLPYYHIYPLIVSQPAHIYFIPLYLLLFMSRSPGAGKTLLLTCLAGRQALDPRRGRVLLNGRPINKRLRRMISFVLQEDLFLDNLSLKDTLMVKLSLICRLASHVTISILTWQLCCIYRSYPWFHPMNQSPTGRPQRKNFFSGHKLCTIFYHAYYEHSHCDIQSSIFHLNHAQSIQYINIRRD